MPNPSGANAHTNVDDLASHFRAAMSGTHEPCQDTIEPVSGIAEEQYAVVRHPAIMSRP